MGLTVRLKTHLSVLVGVPDNISVLFAVVVDQKGELGAEYV